MPESQQRIEKELRRRFRSSTASRTFGFRLVKVGRGRVTLAMKVARRFLQVHGRLHGGAIAALADTAGALAAYTLLPPGGRMATLEMKINFLEGVKRGVVTARARVLRAGKAVTVSECDVRDEEGRLVAKALVTIAAVPAPVSSSGGRPAA